MTISASADAPARLTDTVSAAPAPVITLLVYRSIPSTRTWKTSYHESRPVVDADVRLEHAALTIERKPYFRICVDAEAFRLLVPSVSMARRRLPGPHHWRGHARPGQSRWSRASHRGQTDPLGRRFWGDTRIITAPWAGDDGLEPIPNHDDLVGPRSVTSYSGEGAKWISDNVIG